MEKETGVEISPSIFPGIPQWEKFDFFIVLMSLPTSNGLVFNIDKFGTPCNGSKFGAGSYEVRSPYELGCSYKLRCSYELRFPYELRCPY